MFGVLINRCLLMVFGYAYPAFECYKTLEKNNKSYDLEQLRFWCKYWMIVAIFTVVERIGDILIAWLPFYGEVKLAFLIYLWHPKTKGTGYVYGTILQPYLVKNEAEIERMLMELKMRAWDFGFLLWRNCSDFGQSTFLKALNFAADFNSTKLNNNSTIFQKTDQQPPMASPPSPNDSPSSEPQSGEKMTNSPPPPPPSPAGIKRTSSGETERGYNEEDKETPASPYQRARLRRVNPLP